MKSKQFLFEDFPDMIYATTTEGVITMMNRAGAKLLGFHAPGELVGRNIAEFYENEEDRVFFASLLADQGYVRNLELMLHRKEGTRIVVLDSSVVVRDLDGKVIGTNGIAKDITERIRLENEQLRLSMELTEANRKIKLAQSRLVQQERLASIGQLAAGVAHEINNPLSFVKSNFDTMELYLADTKSFFEELASILKGTPQWDAYSDLFEQRHIQTMLEDSAAIFNESEEGFDRMVSIVRELRTFARTDNSRMEAAFDLNEAIEGAIIMTRNEWKYVATIKREMNDLPLIQCASHGISQVILNLILNAIQALRDDGRQREKIITIRSWAENNWVCCQIEDNAEGVPEQHHNKIFDPFFTTKPPGQGTGLGLSISYDIVVNQHGGDLSFETSPGDGTRFLLRLPRTQQARPGRTGRPHDHNAQADAI